MKERKREREKKQRQRSRAASPPPSVHLSFFRASSVTPPTHQLPPANQHAATHNNTLQPTSAQPINPFCSICREGVCERAVGNCAMYTMPCRHAFHVGCAMSFTRSDCQNHGLCPNCRAGPSSSSSTTAVTPPFSPDSLPKQNLNKVFLTWVR